MASHCALVRVVRGQSFYDFHMGAGLRVRDELGQFFSWLREFEMRVRSVEGGARWYTSAVLEARIQYSWFEAAAAGAPALCISNLRFFSAATGKAFMDALPDWFSSEHHALEAEVLVIADPNCAALCQWLADSAFKPDRAPGELSRSWYCRRTGARTEEPLVVKETDAALTGIWLGLEGRAEEDAPGEEGTQAGSKADQKLEPRRFAGS